MDYNRERHRLLIIPQFCNGYGECVKQCPVGCLVMDPTTKKVRIAEPQLCIGCYTCVKVCPSGATLLEDPYTVVIE